MQLKTWPPFVTRNATVSCSIPGKEDKILPKKFWRGAGRLSQALLGLGTTCRRRSGLYPQLGSLQHRRAPVHDSASGLAKLTDVLNFLKQMQCNLPSVQTRGAQKYFMGCERGRTDFIPGSLTVGGSHDLLLRSRKSVCGFLDVYLVFS